MCVMSWWMLAILSHCQIVLALSATRKDLYETAKGYSHGALVKESSFQASSVSDCCLACVENMKCSHANYNSFTKTCKMGYLRCQDNSVMLNTYTTTISLKSYEASKCEYPWSNLGDVCYLIVTRQETFSDARAHCQGLGGDLAVIDSDTESIYLDRLYECMTGVDAWLGGNVSRGNWMWLTGDVIPNNDRWHSYATTYGCLSARLDSGKFTDNVCTLVKQFICEK